LEYTLGPVGDPVVEPGIEMPRSARADVKREAPIRVGRQHSEAADVERNRAHLHSRFDESVARRLGSFENRVNDGVVADVRPGVIHVQYSDVDPIPLRRWNRIAGANVFEEIVIAVDVASFHCPDHDASGMPCSVSEMM